LSTVFERIIARELPADILYEDDQVIAIQDIHPVAPVHVLLITKEVIPSIQEVGERHSALIGHLISVGQRLAEELGVSDNYRLLTNCGTKAGQTIFHLHFHLIGGRSLGVMG